MAIIPVAAPPRPLRETPRFPFADVRSFARTTGTHPQTPRSDKPEPKRNKAVLKTCLLASLALVSVASAQTSPVEVKARVIIDGKVVGFEGQGPIAMERRLYVPMRGVLEKIGATVTYDKESRTVTASGNSRTITLPLEGSQGVVDGRSMRFAERPIVMNDRVLVPLRLLSEALGAQVDWDAATMTVKITSGTPEIEEILTVGTCARSIR